MPTFNVTLQPSGHEYPVPEGTTVLDAGLAAGMNMPYSCRAGNCRTCRGRVTRGRVDHGGAHGNYLSENDKAEGYALLCRARPLSDLQVQVQELSLACVAPRLMPCRVKRIRRILPDVAIVDLRLPMNENLMFAPGQFVDVLLPGGLSRSYSIATAPSAEGVIDIELHVRRLAGGLFTDRVFTSLREGELLKLHAPLGTFYLREESSKPIVFVATGTGISPVLSMLRYAMRKRFARPMHLYWGGRRPFDLYMNDEIAELQKLLPLRYVPVVSQATSSDAWQGVSGYVQDAVRADLPDLSAHQVYACGSPAMVDAARREFVLQLRLPADEFFGDAFLSAADIAGNAA